MATNSLVSKEIATLRNQSGPISRGALVTGPTGRSELQAPRAPGARTHAGHSFLQRPVASVHPRSHLTAWLRSLHPPCPTVIPQRPACHGTRGPSADPRHRQMAQTSSSICPRPGGVIAKDGRLLAGDQILQVLVLIPLSTRHFLVLPHEIRTTLWYCGT